MATKELYDLSVVAEIFGLEPARLRYWIQSGVLTPSTRRRGRYQYSFIDMIQVKVAVDLMGAGVSAVEVRRMLVDLRAQLPESLPAGVTLHVAATRDEIAVGADAGSAWAAKRLAGDHPLVCSFSTEHLAQTIRRHQNRDEPVAAEPAPLPINERATEPHEQPSAYQCFVQGCQAEDAGRSEIAEMFYERCLALEDGFAAALTNLGNLYYKRGDTKEARRAYERALELDPEQTEARYNLANLLDDSGDTELAIAELRRVVTRSPDFADGHFNLGVILARVGGVSQARRHFRRYLELDGESVWSGRALDYLNALFEAPVARA